MILVPPLQGVFFRLVVDEEDWRTICAEAIGITNGLNGTCLNVGRCHWRWAGKWMEKPAIGYCSGIYCSSRLLSNYVQLYDSSKTLEYRQDFHFKVRMSKSLTSSWERKCRNHQKYQAIKKGLAEREVGLRCMFVGVTGTCDPTKQGSFVTGAWGLGRVQVSWLLACQTVWSKIHLIQYVQPFPTYCWCLGPHYESL